MTESKEHVKSGLENYSIDLQDLEKHFQGKRGMETVKAVDGISFHVKNGEFFGLLGPNGAGKTTTIKMLTGNTRPTGGSATVGGYDIKSELQKVKELISVCPQEFSLYKFLSGIENIEFFGDLHLIPKNEIKERAEKLLKMLGLYDDRKRNVKGYSGGMKRQLSLIVALISNPAILFLDEPTVGMDPRARRKVWDFLKELKQQNKTIILTTHYIEEAEALCDRVAIIDYGKIIALGSPQDLIQEHNVKDLEGVFLKITGRRLLEGM